VAGKLIDPARRRGGFRAWNDELTSARGWVEFESPQCAEARREASDIGPPFAGRRRQDQGLAVQGNQSQRRAVAGGVRDGVMRMNIAATSADQSQ
jgi:hypothetical protein